ncbi:MAG: type III pantothenate kinase [Thermogutta sp.]|nr:type III pantothenate kinase [Thermogutta sp.]
MFVAVDIGNNRLKCGIFPSAQEPASIPKPERTFASEDPAEIVALVSPAVEAHGEAGGMEPATTTWWIASVNRPAAGRLLDCVKRARPEDRLVLVSAADVPLPVRLPHPDRVGIDRLVNALAAERMRRPGHPTVVVDLGTAITVDAVSADGAFLGGAILLGLASTARALHEFTDLLPLLNVETLAAPQALGKDTEAAMRAGLFWGTLGAIRELLNRQAEALGGQTDVVLTGGHAAIFAEHLRGAKHVPHLTLAGIALTAAHCGERKG